MQDKNGSRLFWYRHRTFYTNEVPVVVIPSMLYRHYGKQDKNFTNISPVKEHLSQQLLSKRSNSRNHAPKLAKQPVSFPKHVITLEAIQVRTS